MKELLFKCCSRLVRSWDTVGSNGAPHGRDNGLTAHTAIILLLFNIDIFLAIDPFLQKRSFHQSIFGRGQGVPSNIR